MDHDFCTAREVKSHLVRRIKHPNGLKTDICQTAKSQDDRSHSAINGCGLAMQVASPNMPPKSRNTSRKGQPAQFHEAMGKVMSLLMASASHHELTISELTKILSPPLRAQQYYIMQRDDMPIGYASWAFVDKTVDARLTKGEMKLEPIEWRCGNSPWLVDLITPFGYGAQLLSNLKKTLFSGVRVKMLKATPDSDEVTVCYF